MTTIDAKTTKSRSLSRRSMLLASGSAVAGLATAQGVSAASFDKGKTEVEFWSKYIGTRFKAQAPKAKDVLVLRLIDVEELNSNDPNRPRRLRTPFCLIFEYLRGPEEFTDAVYKITSRDVDGAAMFLSEVLDYEYGEMVIEAVFA